MEWLVSFSYLTAVLLQVLRIQNVEIKKMIILFFSVVAVVGHGLLLYHFVEVQSGQNLSMANVFSLVLWIQVIVIILTMLRKPVANLIIFIFPIAICSIIWASQSQIHPYVLVTKNHPEQFIHVWLGLFALSMVMLASYQAILLSWQDFRLRKKSPTLLTNLLPSLEIMESLLLQWVQFSFVLLILLLLTSVRMLINTWSTLALEKFLFSLIACGVFAALIYTRRLGGLRGRRMAYWTLLGSLFLILAYFGTRFINSF